MNTFNQLHLDGIQKAVGLDSGIWVARSRIYTTSVVIGRPGVPGTVMVGFLVKGIYQGRPAWLVSHYPGSDPKSVADDTLSTPFQVYTEEVYYWADMLKLVKEVFK